MAACEARSAGVAAPTLLTIALTWVVGLVSRKVLPRSWSALLLMGMLGLIAMSVDASRQRLGLGRRTVLSGAAAPE